MRLKKTLLSIAIAGTILVGGNRCEKIDVTPYEYHGNVEIEKDGLPVIGEDGRPITEKMDFFCGEDIILVRQKPDGKIIRYIDNKNRDLKLELIGVSKDSNNTAYSIKNKIYAEIMKTGQEEFYDCLRRISKAKIKQGLSDLN